MPGHVLCSRTDRGERGDGEITPDKVSKVMGYCRRSRKMEPSLALGSFANPEKQIPKVLVPPSYGYDGGVVLSKEIYRYLVSIAFAPILLVELAVG